MDKMKVANFAVPAVVSLVALLSYASQYLFYKIEPGPLDSRQRLIFNTLVLCIWVCYARACTTDPGRVPSDWRPDEATENNKTTASRRQSAVARQRYCRKCEANKPPRSHHCRVCKRYACTTPTRTTAAYYPRCIPKMDHHCPWTVNCVSHFTFPHFMRFLWYAVSAMSYLEYFLFLRAEVVWRDRNLPSVRETIIIFSWKAKS
jgi:palmitoyltransferase